MNEVVISAVKGRRVWDSRGRPTVEVAVRLSDGTDGQAIAPAGASTGRREALDIRDGGEQFGGYDVQVALSGIEKTIAPALIGRSVARQEELDRLLSELDGTDNAAHLGGNAMVATSMALAHARAESSGMPLWRSLTERTLRRLPVPEVQIFGGGAHANRALDLQDFMVVPYGASSFAQALEWTAEIYRAAGLALAQAGALQGVADEGGYWPAFSTNEASIEALIHAIRAAGFDPGTEVGVSLDIAASQIFRDGQYALNSEQRSLSPDDWLDHLSDWLNSYPIILIEDPFEEDDLGRHTELLRRCGSRTRVVGDDLTTTSAARVRHAAEVRACNTLLCKPNQAGNLTKAKAAFDAAQDAGWATIVSARSGESEDVTIAHLAVGWQADFFKVGSFSRSERMAKWNEMIRIEDAIGADAIYAGRMVLPWFDRLAARP